MKIKASMTSGVEVERTVSSYSLPLPLNFDRLDCKWFFYVNRWYIFVKMASPLKDHDTWLRVHINDSQTSGRGGARSVTGKPIGIKYTFSRIKIAVIVHT